MAYHALNLAGFCRVRVERLGGVGVQAGGGSSGETG